MKKTLLTLSNGLLLAILMLFIVAPISCSKEEEDNPDDTLEINAYFASLPTWDVFSPPEADAMLEFDPIQEFSCSDLMVKTTTPCSITKTPEDIVTYDPNSEILYLGSLIQGNGYLQGLGAMQSLPIYQRADLPISISFQMSNNSRLIENPTLVTVKQGIAELVEAAQNAGHISGSSIFFNQATSHSFQQTALALGLSADYMTSSVQASLQWESTNETNTVSAYFVQKMFTVSMGLPQRPGDLFSEEFTQEILDEQVSMGRIGPNNLPVYVSNIVYGRMMTLTMTSTYSETEMKAALSASYNGIDGEISGDHLTTLSESTIKLVTIGGDAQTALNFLRTGQLGEFFRTDAPLTTAVPISYTLRSLTDNSIAKVSSTVDYDMVQYDSASVGIFKNKANWESAMPYHLTEGPWETTGTNIKKANEAGNFSYHSTGQIWMGKKITFSPDTTGMPFEFYLENKDPGFYEGHPEVHLGLVFEDSEVDWPHTISIGDVDNFEDDNFEIGVNGSNVYAIGFVIVDNSASQYEYLKVYAFDGTNECEIDYIMNGDFPGGFSSGFTGVVSPAPIRKIYFNEDADGDDIGVKHFYFGYRPD
ncbi:MAG: thiol-activated cytolysin family protein [Bacteroides sp.]|jgi:hypothetical protein|nr:thiol-activated cytolysin family protein [Bacteroides sp.]